MNTSCRDIIALTFVPGLGDRSIIKLLDNVVDTEEVFGLSGDKISRIIGRSFSSWKDLAGARKSAEYLEELDYIEKEGIRPLSYLDKDYPESLRNIYDPPPILFLKGHISERDINSIAIVGSRRCSLYGIRTAEKLAMELSDAGMTVVSGMARGIDSAAHNGALKFAGRTIAVIGSGFRNIYPPESGELAEKIASSGCVITEHTSKKEPLRAHFPKRNRIISGLSKGVVVVEARERSGALITADFALEHGKDVFAVPGRIDNVSSRGTNRLIKDGAKPVTGVNDILEEIEIEYSSSQELCAQEVPVKVSLSAEEERIFELMFDEPVHIDDLMDKAGEKRGHLCEMLIKLQIKGVVKESPGKIYYKAG